MCMMFDSRLFLDGITCQYLSPFECVRVDNRHFRIYERTSSWFISRQLCKTKRGHLALLKSKRIQRNLSAAILKHHSNTTKYFIGLRGFDYFQGEKYLEFNSAIMYFFIRIKL